MFCSRRLKSARGGFSLVEIMIVILIIGLLAGVVTVNVRSYLTKAKQNIARQDIAVIAGALERFQGENNRYPSSEEGIGVLSRKSDKTSDPYLSSEPIDPWGHSYTYLCPGPKNPFAVICLGADGKEGGDGADGDISSDDLNQKGAK